ncbi:MAG TPA: hypothetical protein VK212_03860 [Lentimicrobium sp.]|nr:hypothetical protein [Lentimicrobium sp.]
MKKVIFTLFVVIVSFHLQAQDELFVKGDKVINLGVGFGNIGWGSGYSSTLLPISGSFEVGVKDNVFDEGGSIGVGGLIGYAGYKYELPGWEWKYTDLILAVRGNLHYPLVNKLDTYAGVAIGYEIVSFKESGDNNLPDYYDAVGSSAFFGLTAGARYYFTDNFAAMGELGYGITWLTLGVAFKL